MIVHDKIFIGGEWVASTGRETIEVISPLTEETIAKVPEATSEDIDRAVAAVLEERAGIDVVVCAAGILRATGLTGSD